MLKQRFSIWRLFPDPRRCAMLIAPLGPGVYELRHRVTGELILVGISARCAHRMTSLLPSPLGSGRRTNSRKRRFILDNLRHIEYRTLACSTRAHAAAAEHRMLRELEYRFPT